VKNASEKNEDVEYRMVVFLVRAYLIKNDADRVKYSAAEQESKSVMTECAVHRAEVEDDSPTHTDVSYHTECLVSLKIYCVERDRERREPPDYKESSDSGCFVGLHKTAQYHRSVSACYEKIYRAVVEDLKNFFRGVSRKCVIYARYGIERYHRNAEDDAADECESATLVKRDGYAGKKRYDSPSAAYDMGDVIKYLLSFGV